MFQSALFILLSVDQLSRHDDLAHYFTLSVAWLLHSCFFFFVQKHALNFLTLTHTYFHGRLIVIKGGSGSRINDLAFAICLRHLPSVKVVRRSVLIRSPGSALHQGLGEADRAVGGDWWGHYLPCCCIPDFKGGLL